MQIEDVMRSVERRKYEKHVQELVALFKEAKPEMTTGEMAAMTHAAKHYAKDILKGKAAELYGMSIDFAIDTLKGKTIPRKEKLLIVTKVLGHMLPTQVTLSGDEASTPILFKMSRPAKAEVEEDEEENQVKKMEELEKAKVLEAKIIQS